MRYAIPFALAIFATPSLAATGTPPEICDALDEAHDRIEDRIAYLADLQAQLDDLFATLEMLEQLTVLGIPIGINLSAIRTQLEDAFTRITDKLTELEDRLADLETTMGLVCP